MIKSMTGYGKATAETQNRAVTVEVRSVNSKQLDLSVKLPSLYRPLEYEIRNRAAKIIQRGKADIFINFENKAAAPSATINKELFTSYYNTLSELASSGALSGGTPVADSPCEQERQGLMGAIIASVLRLPEVVSSDTGEVSPQEQTALMVAVDGALSAFEKFREQEGDTLMADILARVGSIHDLRHDVEPFESRRVELLRTRIRENILSLDLKVDENRLEQEMIFYIEKLDVTEEKVRLDNHCRYFREVAREEENPGRKLGFIAQEIGREINTLGSKANDSDIQKIVVQMKDELEKIKEQILNIL